MYVFEYEKNIWNEINLNFDMPRWNHSAIVIPALPQWKLFIFGGSSAYFEEGAPRHFGKVLNSVMYLDLPENLEETKIRKLRLEDEATLPKQRENSSIIYDQSEQRILIFGGWSNNMRNDLFQLNISAITGPEYAIYDIQPNLGPLTGNTSCCIRGEGFKSTQNFQVKFISKKFQESVSATFESEKELRCKTPNFEEAGPQKVEVRIQMDQGDLTITNTFFNYFLNTKADNTISFGHGLLPENSIGKDTHFFIQARNINNENRQSGKDKFEICFKKIQVAEEEAEDPEGGEPGEA
jgi:dynein heavy chain